MWDMFLNSARLFMRGKLFREPGMVARQWLLGVMVSAVLTVLLVRLFGWGPVPAATLVGLLVGAWQPVLFKDLKYN